MKLIKTRLGMFLTQIIHINDVAINCIIDTGSPVTMIGKKLVRPKGKTEFVDIHSLNGGKQQSLKTKFNVEFSYPSFYASVNGGKAEEFKGNVPIIITDLKHVQENYGKKHNIRGIIGMDIISKTNWLNLDK